MDTISPHYDRPRISRILEAIEPYGVDIFISGSDGASDVGLLRSHGVSTVVNCAVNLDLNYVMEPQVEASGTQIGHGSGAIRYYKLGLIDGPGNPETMMLAGYYLLQGAFKQILPDRSSYPRRERGNVLVNCRGGRSRSVVLVSLFLHHTVPNLFPTLDSALDHVRTKRELRQDEWFEAPKPMLIEAARRASKWINYIEADLRQAS
ncbi:dual specificity protein phosphatase family protein [Devosia naphthalenivorans]|uniref:dual specificity protein phosphatase family protein n=1 Tax=Devosia naphthalenivorans TaxID=2082392 RepID=UPI000D3C7603|nr:dual specificity protein phosphatase [Devosia naphthalenivorans]